MSSVMQHLHREHRKREFKESEFNDMEQFETTIPTNVTIKTGARLQQNWMLIKNSKQRSKLDDYLTQMN